MQIISENRNYQDFKSYHFLVTNPSEMYYDQLTSPQIAALDKSIPVVLPIAATEQHGPHLPLATDRMIGEHFCKAIHEAIPNEVLILPVISIGCSEHHTLFSGSLSFQHDTMLRQMQDIAHWVCHHGFQNFIVFNSHGGNQSIGKTFVEIFGFRHPECQVLLLTWWQLIQPQLQTIVEGGPEATGHAGELETSLMLLIAPHLVHRDKIPEFANLPIPKWTKSNLMQSPKGSFYKNFKQLSPNGVIGSPKYATKEKGRQVTEAVVAEFINILKDIK